MFGFADISRVGTRTLDERTYAVTLEALGGRVPVVVVPPSDDLDRAERAPAERRVAGARPPRPCRIGSTPSDGALWGLCSNGDRSSAWCATTPASRGPPIIEADLRRIFEAEAFADFAALWLLIHASRFGVPAPAPTDCALERWREAGGKEGLAARDRLRDGVEAALLSLGQRLPRTSRQRRAARAAASGAAAAAATSSASCLRLVYRLIFLLAAEDRNLLHPPDAPAGRAQALCRGLFPRPRCATAPSAARPGTGTTTAGRGC